MSIGLIAFCRFWEKVEQYHIVHTDAGEITIPKFDGSNYKIWAAKVQAALRAIGAWRIVTGEFKDPGKNAPSEQLEAYRTLNDKGCALIYFSIEQEVLESMDGLDIITGCKATWNLFQFTFSDASLESIFQQDILEDIRAVNDFRDADIVNWIEQRKKTIKLVEFWYKGLKWISNGSKCAEVLSLVASLCGNFLDIFFPGFTFLGNSKNLIFYGRSGHLTTKVLELLGSEVFLSNVRAALEEDAKKSAPLGQLFQRMARLNTRLRSDFDVGFWQYVWFSLKCKGISFCAVQEIITFQGLKLNGQELTEFAYASLQIIKKYGLLRSVGEASLVRLGIGNRNVTLVLGAAELCLDLLDLYNRFKQNQDPEYLKLVETKLESLKNELKYIENGCQPQRGENVE